MAVELQGFLTSYRFATRLILSGDELTCRPEEGVMSFECLRLYMLRCLLDIHAVRACV